MKWSGTQQDERYSEDVDEDEDGKDIPYEDAFPDYRL
jgi:hypothetical protein